MSIFETIISPFIFLIKHIFLFSYEITGNYGISIILLSFAVSLLLLPVFIYIEKNKKKDDIVKLKMKPLIDEVKRVYKGQERYYYIKTINRQHNYSSFKALIPILSLLIQIPFFIAAYQFLENYEPLKEVSFAFIKDLSKPDGLFGGIVNILPIIMTVVNLLTAYFYTINGDGSERKQMLIVAIAFLILLFDLPSGLVLYWTMNNVFSFLRLFITNPEVFRNRRKIDFKSFISEYRSNIKILIKLFKIILVLLVVVQLIWAFNHYFTDFYIRLGAIIIISIVLTFIIGILLSLYKLLWNKILQIKINPNLFFLTLFLGIYFYLASQYYFTGENLSLLILGYLFLIPSQIIGFLYVLKDKTRKSKSLYKSLFILLASIFVFQLIILITFIVNNNISINISNIHIFIKNGNASNFLIPGIVFSLLTIPFILKENNIKIIKLDKSYYFIYLLSILFIFGLIFIWQPLLVYSSSPDTFDFPAIFIILYNYKIFLITIAISFVIYIISPKIIKKGLLLLALMLVTISFINSLVMPVNLGSLQVSQFSEENNLAFPIMNFIIEAIVLIIIYFAISWIFKKKFFVVTSVILVLINIIIIFQSFYTVIDTGKFYADEKDLDNTESKGIPFAKDKQNIVYFLADGFQGWYIHRILEEEPALKKELEGFTWYPNTISQSNYTHTSLPCLFNGLDYSVNKINADTTKSVKELIQETSINFMNKARKKGFSYSSTIMHYSDIKPVDFDNYIPFWNDAWKKYSFDVALGLDINVWKKRLYENALFYSLPIFIKPKIYNKTKWLDYFSSKTDTLSNKKPKYSTKRYNFIRLLPSISIVENENKNFIYIHDHSLHNPWNTIDDNGIMHEDVNAYENNKWFIQKFARWIKWMKDNGVYNNTKIVVVSDHGASWEITKNAPDIISSVNWDDKKELDISKRIYWRLNALLMVKDFNKTGELQEDWRLMTNADAPYFVFNEDNPALKDSTSRTIEAYFTGWQSKILYEKKVKITHHYSVHDNIFDLKNWKSIK